MVIRERVTDIERHSDRERERGERQTETETEGARI